MTVQKLAQHLQKLPRNTRAILLTCIYGLVAGAVAVLFQLAITWFYELTIVKLSTQSTKVFLIGSFLVIMPSGLLVGYLLNSFCKEASGSGIPQLKLMFWKDFGYVPWRVVWVKFLAGVASVGGGCSLGREGPSVQIAGGLASNLAGLLGEPKQNRRNAAAAGAAAGLAAAFNTPLAAMTFVLEEIVEDLNSRFLGSVLLASVIGAFVVYGLIGKQPAFSLADVDSVSWHTYLLVPLVAAAATLVGIVFHKSTLGLRAKRKQFERIPAWSRPAIGAFITWVLGSMIFLKTGHLGVFGLGYEDLSAAMTHQLPWKLAGVLLLAKLVATFACYGFGGCGGIFAPTLFLGGMCGVFLAGLSELAFPLEASDHTVLAVVGMSACLGAVVRAPVTGILIVFEMTHQFALVPALMLGTLISQALSIKLAKLNFYEDILRQDGHNLEHVIPPRDLQTWQQLPVSAIATFQPALVLDLGADALRKLLRTHPYQRFPVVVQKQVVGLVRREEIELSLKEDRKPTLDPASWCLPGQSIRELQSKLLESSTGVVVLLDKPQGRVLGIVTLHDLLRAEMSIAKKST